MAHFTLAGNVWDLSLSDHEVGMIHDAADLAAIVAGAGVLPPLNLAVAGAIKGVSEVIKAVNLIGGNNGVHVAGILPTQFVTVTPAFASPVAILGGIVQKASERTGIPEEIIGGGLLAGVTWLAAGPAYAIWGGLAGALGTWDDDGPNPGDVHADRHQALSWEKFVLVTLNPNRCAILSWRGYFSAERGGGDAVHANRSWVQDWENFHLERNGDGTVSFRHPGGHYLVAEGGGGNGSVCNWNRVAVGPWEKFWMENHSDGTFSLKTFVHGTYVSVQ